MTGSAIHLLGPVLEGAHGQAPGSGAGVARLNDAETEGLGLRLIHEDCPI